MGGRGVRQLGNRIASKLCVVASLPWRLPRDSLPLPASSHCKLLKLLMLAGS